MDYSIDISAIHSWGQDELLPLLKEWDKKEAFPPNTLKACQALGLFGLLAPKAYGGLDVDAVTFSAVIETLSKISPSVAVMIAVHNSVCIYPICVFGDQPVKDKYLAKLASGEWIGSFGLTEVGAGSDAANIRTEATFDSDKREFLVNGSKVFITNGLISHVSVVLVKTEPALGAKGTTCLVLDKSMAGFTVGKKEQKLGLRMSDTTELHFDRVAVPEKNILGKKNQGFAVVMQTLDSSRIGIAAQAVGIGKAVLAETIRLCKAAKSADGKPFAWQQHISLGISELATEVEAAALLVYQASLLKDQNKDFVKQGSMAKLFASKMAVETAQRALSLLGYLSFGEDSMLERLLRDAKITEIYEGTSEVQKMVIAKLLLI